MLREPPLGLKRRTFLPFLEAEEVCELSISLAVSLKCTLLSGIDHMHFNF
jgi:hypothetical protein